MKIEGQSALVYWNIIFIFSRTADKRIDRVWQVLTLLHDEGVTLNLKKIEFFTNHNWLSGNVIHVGRLNVSTSTLDAIISLEQPTSVTERRSDPGFCNVSRRFVQHFALVAASLSKNLPKAQMQTFDASTGEKMIALEKLKARLVELSLLARPHWQSSFTVMMDACDM